MYTVPKYGGVGCQKVEAKDYLDAITLYYTLLGHDEKMSITDVKGISCHLVKKFCNFYVGDVKYGITKLYEFIRSAIYDGRVVYDYLRGNNEFINVDFTLINCVHEKSIKGIVNLLIRCKRLLRLLEGHKDDTVTYVRKTFTNRFTLCDSPYVDLNRYEDILYIVTFNGNKSIAVEDVITNIKCMMSYICRENKEELYKLYEVISEITSYLYVEDASIGISFDRGCPKDCYYYEIDDSFKGMLKDVKCVGDLQDLLYAFYVVANYLRGEGDSITLGKLAGYMLSHAYLSRVGGMSILNTVDTLDSVEYEMIREWSLHKNFIENSCRHIHQSYCVHFLNTFNGYITNGTMNRLDRILYLIDKYRDTAILYDKSIVIDDYMLDISQFIPSKYIEKHCRIEVETALHKVYGVLNMYSTLWNTTIIPLNSVEVFKCLSCMSDDTLTCGSMLDVNTDCKVYVRDIVEETDYTHSYCLQYMSDYSGIKTYKEIKEIKESNRVVDYVKNNIKDYVDSLRLLVNGFKEVCSYRGVDKVFLDCESQQIDCFGYMISLHNGKNRRVSINCPNLSSTIYHMCMDCFHEGFTENSLYEMLVALNRLYGYLNDALANVGLRDEYYEVLKDISHDLFVVEEMFNKVMGHSKCVNHKADNVSKQLVQDFIDNGYVLAVKDGDDIVVYTEDKSQSEVVPKSLHKYFYNIDSIDMLPLVYYVYHCEGY
jgi:hypothetical protein|nr:MAG TPA: hypothetical protein [Bacteriophage sp.]